MRFLSIFLIAAFFCLVVGQADDIKKLLVEIRAMRNILFGISRSVSDSARSDGVVASALTSFETKLDHMLYFFQKYDEKFTQLITTLNNTLSDLAIDFSKNSTSHWCYNETSVFPCSYGDSQRVGGIFDWLAGALASLIRPFWNLLLDIIKPILYLVGEILLQLVPMLEQIVLMLERTVEQLVPLIRRLVFVLFRVLRDLVLMLDKEHYFFELLILYFIIYFYTYSHLLTSVSIILVLVVFPLPPRSYPSILYTTHIFYNNFNISEF